MNNVPRFPDMRPLTLGDKPLLDTLLASQQPEISEYTFTNLFAWRKAYDFCVSQADGVFLVVSRRDGRLDIFDPLCPAGKKRAVVESCFFLSSSLPTAFVRMPEEAVRAFQGDGAFAVAEERDHFDYLYRTQDLVALKGTAYDGKRNFIKRFKEARAFEYRVMKAEDVEKCFYFEEEWCLARDCQRTEGLAREREAMHEILSHFEALGVQGAMILIDGKVEAVTLGEALNSQTFVIHIEKANGSFVGIYQAINQMFCEQAAQGYVFVNREQDLGVAGLRQAKESYHPCRLVKKYTLQKK
ncbi:MAG: phosphatidylglycerol lysyltransferase domain-containing protein [Candidatus Omnitrophica bacterium]|nr:phosphatidylglycerol lysyltransferase domain-containing protein [Candidatus Omnitrophota bacterium]